MKTDSLDANLSIAVAFWHLKCDRGAESIMFLLRNLEFWAQTHFSTGPTPKSGAELTETTTQALKDEHFMR